MDPTAVIQAAGLTLVLGAGYFALKSRKKSTPLSPALPPSSTLNPQPVPPTNQRTPEEVAEAYECLMKLEVWGRGNPEFLAGLAICHEHFAPPLDLPAKKTPTDDED